MNNQKIKTLCKSGIALLCTFVIGLSPICVHAGSIEELEKKTDNLEGKLSGLNSQLKSLTGEIDKLIKETEKTDKEYEKAALELAEAKVSERLLLVW